MGLGGLAGSPVQPPSGAYPSHVLCRGREWVKGCLATKHPHLSSATDRERRREVPDHHVVDASVDQHAQLRSPVRDVARIYSDCCLSRLLCSHRQLCEALEQFSLGRDGIPQARCFTKTSTDSLTPHSRNPTQPSLGTRSGSRRPVQGPHSLDPLCLARSLLHSRPAPRKTHCRDRHRSYRSSDDGCRDSVSGTLCRPK